MEKDIKKMIVISSVIATILTIILFAIYDLEATLVFILSITLIVLIAMVIGSIWNGVVEIKNEVKIIKERKNNKKIGG